MYIINYVRLSVPKITQNTKWILKKLSDNKHHDQIKRNYNLEEIQNSFFWFMLVFRTSLRFALPKTFIPQFYKFNVVYDVTRSLDVNI